ncbi:hypothetical protein RQM47_00550 [Rubrivirga sp. S365]|uniref:Uncharacterized protein n=1 Tax=Rubrivirga litoralis TaxID=3075598 RepID=A0ABU3BVC6_9BACT|nr:MULTISPECIES: hypothetical protein [unclassified Rubrivirga]MDT0633235.1 hypothetical protein [Rubrivirga sp. F394]MDT7855125.1 hypothetical protein [Rubrivirga sp. S365]
MPPSTRSRPPAAPPTWGGVGRTAVALGLAALVVLAGCGSEPAAPRSAAAPSAEVEEAPADRPAPEVRPGVPLDRILALHDDPAAFLAGLRPPRQTHVELVANEYTEGQVDTVRTRVYDGMEVVAYEVTDGPTFVQSVTIMGTGYGTSGGVAVGEAREALEDVLGRPVDERSGAVLYEIDSGPAPTAVEVRYETDEDGVARAAEVTWRPYLD